MAEPVEPLQVVQERANQRRAEALREFRGFHWGTDFIGFAVATFFTVVFFAIVGAIVGTVGYQLNAPVPKLTGHIGSHIGTTTQQLGMAGLVGGLVALFLAYFIGGYTAGRMARFDGAQQGVGVVIWSVIVSIVLGVAGWALGQRFNLPSQVHFSISTQTLTTAGLISLAVALVVMLVAAILGGIMGVRYNKRVDRQMLNG